MESCPSGLRSMIGNHVCGVYRTQGSNPWLSAISKISNDLVIAYFLFVKILRNLWQN